jgi:hypothetical protein
VLPIVTWRFDYTFRKASALAMLGELFRLSPFSQPDAEFCGLVAIAVLTSLFSEFAPDEGCSLATLSG